MRQDERLLLKDCDETTPPRPAKQRSIEALDSLDSTPHRTTWLLADERNNDHDRPNLGRQSESR